MSEHKTKDQEEKGDVTLHGGKPVSMAQAETEAAVGGPIEGKAVHGAKDKAVHKAKDKVDGQHRAAHMVEADAAEQTEGDQAQPAHWVEGAPCEEVSDAASVKSHDEPLPRDFFSAGLGVVQIYATKAEARSAAVAEAEAAGITPAAVMHVSPEGASTADG